MAIAEIEACSGGGSKFRKITVPYNQTQTVNLDFEAKTIVASDSDGYSAVWSINLNMSNHEYYWTAPNNSPTNVSYSTWGGSYARLVSRSNDGKTLTLFGYTGSGSGGTTFWIYGDEE